MASIYTVAYRRKRQGITDYKKRMKLLLGNKPRIVIRKSLKHLTIQIIEFKPKGDKIIATANTKELEKYGWKAGTSNTTAAYLTGYLLAKKTKNIICVADIGQYTSVKGCRLYAAIKGAIDGGMKINCSEEIIPDMKRISGDHIAQYAKKLKENKEEYQKQFNTYIKQKIEPEKIPEYFEQVKKNIGAK